MLPPDLERVTNLDLKTAKTIKIRQSSVKIWRFKVWKKTPFPAIFSNKMAFLQIFKRHIFSASGRVSNVFTVLRSSLDNPFNEFTNISLIHVYYFGAKNYIPAKM